MHKCAFTWGESKESLNVENLYPQEYFFILFLKMVNIVQCVLITCQNQFLPYKAFSWDLTEIWEWMATKTLISMLHHLSINIDDPLGRGVHQVLGIQGRERRTSLPHLREIPTQHWTCRFSDTWWRPFTYRSFQSVGSPSHWPPIVSIVCGLSHSGYWESVNIPQ